jgi:NADH-quinone oxidoreductase subunit J
MLVELYFLYFAAAIIGLSITVVTRKNPVHSVLWMLLLFFNIAGLYLMLNAEMMAAIQIIVYAGAILVLFLFVVLLLDLKKEIDAEQYVGIWPTGVAVAVALFTLILIMTRSFVAGPHGNLTIERVRELSHPGVIGRAMFTEYLFPFEVASLVLLVAVIGAIILAKKRIKE